VIARQFEWNRDIVAAVLLCAAAGMTDAIGYVRTGIFAANMTGNTVLTGLALAQGEWLSALQRGATVGTFFGGAMLGRLMLNLTGNRPSAPLAVEAALVAAAAFVQNAAIDILMITFAMGVQTTALTRFKGVALSTVVMTSTIARLAETATDRVIRGFGRRAPHHGVPNELLGYTWGAYAAGAALAGLVIRFVSISLVLPALVVLIVTALYTRALTPRA
jgi:uncharacterized membrane protein YoaK (UPF0700 family)